MMTLPDRSQLWWNLQTEQAPQEDQDSGPTWQRSCWSLFLERKSEPSCSFCSQRGRGRPTPCQPERRKLGALLDTLSHSDGLHHLLHTVARGRRTGGSRFGRRAAVRESQNSLGVFPVGFRWGQVAQNRHIQAASAAPGRKQKALEAHSGVYGLSSCPVGMSSGTQVFSTTR